MDISQLIPVRTQGVSQMLIDGTFPEDVVFTEKKGSVNISLIPYKGQFPPSQRYSIRKQVASQIIDGGVIPNNKSFDKLFFFSYDPLMGVDYGFEITPCTSKCVLYIIKNGTIIRRYNPYDSNHDERNDIANISSEEIVTHEKDSIWNKIKQIFK